MGIVPDPETPQELADQLRAAAAAKQAISLAGNSSKNRMAGPIAAAAQTISTRALTRILPAGFGTSAARRLLEMPAFVRHVVLDRWFLHAREPALTAL